jgi:AraC-like DNA-binding protein
VFEFDFDHTDFRSLLKDLARQLGVDLQGDTLYFKPEQGEGYIHAFNLPNGLSILISSNCLEFDSYLHRRYNPELYYILNFDEIYIRSQYTEIINRNRSQYPPPVYSGACLNTTFFDKITFSTKGNGMRLIKCLFNAEWMSKFLGIKKNDEVLLKYLALRAKNLNFEPMDAEYRMLVNDIFDTDPENPLFATITENRIMLLIELFFTRIYKRSGDLRLLKFSEKDIYRLMEIESNLVHDFTKTPLTVEELADKYGIGASKLKRQFKQIYGKPLYEYYQKYRMEKAKHLLLSGQYTVKEVGYKMGYQNLSNFASAFKKEFGALPSELTKS